MYFSIAFRDTNRKLIWKLIGKMKLEYFDDYKIDTWDWFEHWFEHLVLFHTTDMALRILKRSYSYFMFRFEPRCPDRCGIFRMGLVWRPRAFGSIREIFVPFGLLCDAGVARDAGECWARECLALTWLWAHWQRFYRGTACKRPTRVRDLHV